MTASSKDKFESYAESRWLNTESEMELEIRLLERRIRQAQDSLANHRKNKDHIIKYGAALARSQQ